MDEELTRVLEMAYPGEEPRYFPPMSIGSTSEHADQGATPILNGVKTLTSSPFWDYPDGKIPFVGRDKPGKTLRPPQTCSRMRNQRTDDGSDFDNDWRK